MNAELDNRFKEIDQVKIDFSDAVKPRLNVFGNSSKTNNQSGVKLSFHTPKPKRNEFKCGNTTKNSEAPNQNVLGETVNSTKIADKPQKLKASVTNVGNGTIAHSNQTKNNVHSINKSSNHIDSQTSTVLNPTSGLTSTNNTNVCSSTETGMKKNISSDGLIK